MGRKASRPTRLLPTSTPPVRPTITRRFRTRARARARSTSPSPGNRAAHRRRAPTETTHGAHVERPSLAEVTLPGTKARCLASAIHRPRASRARRGPSMGARASCLLCAACRERSANAGAEAGFARRSATHARIGYPIWDSRVWKTISSATTWVRRASPTIASAAYGARSSSRVSEGVARARPRVAPTRTSFGQPATMVPSAFQTRRFRRRRNAMGRARRG